MLARASAVSPPLACGRRPRRHRVCLAGAAHLVGLAVVLLANAAEALQSAPRDAGGGRLEFADCRRLARDGAARGGGAGGRGPLAGRAAPRQQGPGAGAGAGAPAAFVVRGVCAGPVLVCAAPPPHLPDCGAGGVCPLPGDSTRYCRCGTRGAYRLRAVYRCPPTTHFSVAEGRCVAAPAVTEPLRPCDEAGPQLEAPPLARDAGASAPAPTSAPASAPASALAPAPTSASANSAGREASTPAETPATPGAAETDNADAASAAARDADGAAYDAVSRSPTSGNSTERGLAGPVATNTPALVVHADSSDDAGTENANIRNGTTPAHDVPAKAAPTSAHSGNFHRAPDSAPTSQTASFGSSATQKAPSDDRAGAQMGQKPSSRVSTLTQTVLGPAANPIASTALTPSSVNASTPNVYRVPVSSIPVSANSANIPVGNAPAYKHPKVNNTKVGVPDTNPVPFHASDAANNRSNSSVPNPTARPTPVSDPVSVHDRPRSPDGADASSNVPQSNCTCSRCGQSHVLDSYVEGTPFIVGDANADRMPVGMRVLDSFLQENDRRFQEMLCSKTITERGANTREDSNTTVVVLQNERGQNVTQVKCKGGKVLDESSSSTPPVGLHSNAKSSTYAARGTSVWQYVPLYTLRNEESKQLSNIGLCGVTGVVNTGDDKKEEIKNWEFLGENTDFEGPQLKLKDILESIARSENEQHNVKNMTSSESITVSTNNSHLSKNVQVDDNSHRNGSKSSEQSDTNSRRTRDKDGMNRLFKSLDSNVDSSDLVTSRSEESEREDLIDKIKEGVDTLQDNLEPCYFVDSHDCTADEANYNTNSRKISRRDCSDMLRTLESRIECSSENSKLKERLNSKAVQKIVDVLSASMGSIFPEDEKIISKKCINLTALRTLFNSKEDEEDVKETVNCTSIKQLHETQCAPTPEDPPKIQTKPPTDTHHCKCDIHKSTLIESETDKGVNSDFSDVIKGSQNHDKLSDSHANHLHCRDRTLALNILYLLFKALDDSLSDDIVPEHNTERPPVLESEKHVKKVEPFTGSRIALNTNPDPHDSCYWDFGLKDPNETVKDDLDESDQAEILDQTVHTLQNTVQEQLHHSHNTQHSSHSTSHSKSDNQRQFPQNTEDRNSEVNRRQPSRSRKETYTRESSEIKNRNAVKSPVLSTSRCQKIRDFNTKNMKDGTQTCISKKDSSDQVSHKTEAEGRNSKVCSFSADKTNTKSRSTSPFSTASSVHRKTDERSKFTRDQTFLHASSDDASWMIYEHYNAPRDYSEEDWQAFIWQKQLESSEEKPILETFTIPATTGDMSASKSEFDKLMHDSSRERVAIREGSESNESEDIAGENWFEKFKAVLTENERLREQLSKTSTKQLVSRSEETHVNRRVCNNVKEQTNNNKSLTDSTRNSEQISIPNQNKSRKRKYSDVLLKGTRRQTNLERENNSRETHETFSSEDDKITAARFRSECEREEKSFCCSVEESSFWDDSTEENSWEKQVHDRNSNRETKLDVAVSRGQQTPQISKLPTNSEEEQDVKTEESNTEYENVGMGMVSSEEDAGYWDFSFEDYVKELSKNIPKNNVERGSRSGEEGYNRPSVCICMKPTLPLTAPTLKHGCRSPKRPPIETTKQETRKHKINVEPENISNIDEDEKYTAPSVCICSKPTLPLIAPAQECDRDLPNRVPAVTIQPQMSKNQRRESEQTETYDTDDEKYTGPSVCIRSKPTLPLVAPSKKCDRDFSGRVSSVTTQPKVTKNEWYEAQHMQLYETDDEKDTGPSVCICSKPTLPLVAPSQKCTRDFPDRVPTVTTQSKMTENKRRVSKQMETYDTDDAYMERSERIRSKHTVPLVSPLKKCDRNLPVSSRTTQSQKTKHESYEAQQTEIYESNDEDYGRPSVCICSKPTLPLVAPSQKCNRDFPDQVLTVTTQPQMMKHQRSEQTEIYDTDDEEYSGPSVCICSKPTLPLIAPTQKCKCEIPQNKRCDTHVKKTSDSNKEYTSPTASMCSKPNFPLNAPPASWDFHRRRPKQSEATEAPNRESNIVKFSRRERRPNDVRPSPQRTSDMFSSENMETSVDDEIKASHNRESDAGTEKTWNIKMERQTICQHKKDIDSKIPCTICDNVPVNGSHGKKRRTGRIREDYISENESTNKELDTSVEDASSRNSDASFIDGNSHWDESNFEISSLQDAGVGAEEFNENISFSSSETSQEETSFVDSSMVPPLYVSPSETSSQSARASSTKSTKQLDSSRKSYVKSSRERVNNDVEIMNSKRNNVKTSHSVYNGNKKSINEGYLEDISDDTDNQNVFKTTDDFDKEGRKLDQVSSYRTPLTSTLAADVRGRTVGQELEQETMEVHRPKKYPQQRIPRPNRRHHDNEYFTDANAEERLDEVDDAAAPSPQEIPSKYSNGQYPSPYLRLQPTNPVQLLQVKKTNPYRTAFPEKSRGPNVHDLDSYSNKHETQPQERHRHLGQGRSYTTETGRLQAGSGPADTSSTSSGPGDPKSYRRNPSTTINLQSSSASATTSSETSDTSHLSDYEWFLHRRPWARRMHEKYVT